MEISVSELATLIGGQLASQADGSLRISGVAAVSDAQEGHATFLSSPKYLRQLQASKASVALVPPDFSEAVPPALIHVENPTVAFSKLIEHFAEPAPNFPPGVHPTAVIGKNVQLGSDVSIQPFVVIEDGARIGDRTIIGAHSYIGHEAQVGADALLHPRVTIGYRCVVGSRVIFHSGVVLGSDGFGFEFQQGRHVKVPQVGIVQVDDDVEIGANTTIDRARFGKTWIQAGTKIDNLVQIGHNVIIGKHCILCGQVGIAGSAKLGNYVTMAGQSGTNGHIEIGDQVLVGGQSGMAKSVGPNGMYMGTPAIPARDYRVQVANLHGLNKLKARISYLEQILDEKRKSLPPEM